jgi:hypothetical protein
MALCNFSADKASSGGRPPRQAERAVMAETFGISGGTGGWSQHMIACLAPYACVSAWLVLVFHGYQHWVPASCTLSSADCRAATIQRSTAHQHDTSNPDHHPCHCWSSGARASGRHHVLVSCRQFGRAGCRPVLSAVARDHVPRGGLQHLRTQARTGVRNGE